MNLHQFQASLPQFTHAYDKFEQRRKRKVVRTGKKRLRQVGGRPPDFKAFQDEMAARSLCDEFTDYRVTSYGDSGFDGMSALGLPVEVRLNEPARRNHPLTREQQKLNRLRSGTCLAIEHPFSRRKKYGTPLKSIATVMRTTIRR